MEPTDKGLLAGSITDSTGPVSGATVVITRATPGDTSNSPGCLLVVRVTSDAQGRYSVPLCQLGDQLGYHVKISAPAGSAESDLFVNAGRTTNFRVRLAGPPTKSS